MRSDTAEAVEADPLFNQSLEKGLAVLRAFDATHRTMTLADIAVAAGMNKASAQRTVHTLQVLGYIGKHPQTRRFRLLPKVMELGFSYVIANSTLRAAHPYLSQLAHTSGETACLTEPIGLDMMYVSQSGTSAFIPMLTPIGMRVPMYCTSSGRAYLSRLPDESVRQMIEQSNRVARTPHTRVEVDDVLATIDECRRVGFAMNVEELFLGDMGVGAPIVDSRGTPLGAVHLAPPSSHWTAESARQKLGPLVAACARAISESLPH